MATKITTCPNCSAQNSSFNSTCQRCGAALFHSPMQPAEQNKPASLNGADKKVVAGICGILLGGFGVHKFILGYQQEGIIMLSVYLVGLVITLVTCGIGVPIPLAISVIGLVEGIIYLTKSDEEFVMTYVRNKKPWF